MNNYRKAAINIRKSNIQEIRRNFRRISFESVKQEDVAYEAWGPIWEKANLTIEEAAAYFGIGQNRLRELTEDEQCKFVLFVGTKRLIKRRLFEQYLEQAYSI